MNGRPDVDYYEGYEDGAIARPQMLGRSLDYYRGYADGRAGTPRNPDDK